MGNDDARLRLPTRNGVRATLVALIGTAVAVPLALTGPVGTASAAEGPQQEGGSTMSASSRTQPAPNVVYPLPAYAKGRDLKKFRPGYEATQIVAACGVAVRAVHPGTVKLTPNQAAGGTMVSVSTSDGRLTTYYGYMRRVSVTDGQILSAGQQVGQVGDLGNSKGCMLSFRVATSGTTGGVNPTDWLEKYVGKPVPDNTIFGNTGFTLGTINALGASHTAKGGDATSYPSWATRMPRLVSYMRSKAIDVAGMQELQKAQHKALLAQAKEYAAYPPNQSMDTENAIVWNRNKFAQVEAHTVNIPYFNGAIRKMPYVLLKQKATGRTFWLINVHNPADTKKFKNQGKWRAKAVAIEKDLIIRLRGGGRPVYLTGDMNDRQGVFCAITANKLALSADSVPSMACAPPKSMWIDWIFAAGQTRFSWYVRDWKLRDDLRASDHPAVYAKAFISE